MIGTIGPVVNGAGRRISAGRAALTAASLAASVIVGLALGSAGLFFPSSPAFAVAVAVGSGYAMVYVTLGRIPATRWPRQMPRRWIQVARPIWTTLKFGFVMGLGFGTPIRAASLVVLALALVAIHDPISAALVFGVFGLTRAVPAALATVPSFDDETVESFRRMVKLRPLLTGLDVVGVVVASTLMLHSVIG